jgi:hypothetical protein
MNQHPLLDTLAPLRAHTGARRTTGLDDATILKFASSHPELAEAIQAAAIEHERVRAEFPELLDLDEAEQAHVIQAGYVNFYSDDTVNPTSRWSHAGRGSSRSTARCCTTRAATACSDSGTRRRRCWT